MKQKDDKTYGIIGLGRFGTALVKKLTELDAEVLAMDLDETKVKAIRGYTEHALVADSLSKEVLMEAGIQNCDTVVVCIGEKIDTSILTTLNVVSLGVPHVIAKAISAEQGLVLQKIGAEVVYPEHDMAIRLAKRLRSNNVLEYISLSNEIEISELKISEKCVGKSIVEMDFRRKYGLNVIAVEHADETITDISPDYRFAKGDIIVVIGKSEQMKKLEHL